LRHHPNTVAKLYSAFVRAMTRCAEVFGGEVRGIIGDRVMLLFDSTNCYTNAVDTAELINSVCQYVLNRHFMHAEVSFGIGVDYGRMLATKTGVRRHGSAQQSYRSLVWLGRPANVVKLKVAYDYLGDGTPPVNVDEWPHDFVEKFTYDPVRRMMVAPNFHSFTVVKERIVDAPATPPILMSKRVYDGFKAARPSAIELRNDWFTKVNRRFPDVPDEVFGGNVVYIAFMG